VFAIGAIGVGLGYGLCGDYGPYRYYDDYDYPYYGYGDVSCGYGDYGYGDGGCYIVQQRVNMPYRLANPSGSGLQLIRHRLREPKRCSVR
jgi:hypothetical protein